MRPALHRGDASPVRPVLERHNNAAPQTARQIANLRLDARAPGETISWNKSSSRSMANGPLAVRWGEWTLESPQAGAMSVARVELENTGTVPWRDDIRLSYHWLDDRDNPIVWDGLRTELPPVAPGESGERRGARTVADPSGPLPLRARSRRRVPGVVLGARERAGLGRRRGEAARRRFARRASPAGRARPRLGRARSGGACGGLRGRRGDDRVGGRARPPPPARARSLCAGAGPGTGILVIRSCAHPCSRGSSSSGCRTSPDCRRSRRLPRSPGSTTAGSSCAPGPDAEARARARAGRRAG